MEQIAFILIAAWAVYGVFGPWERFHATRNEHNILWRYKSPRTVRQAGVKPENDPAAVDVHETGEWRLSKLLGVVMGLIVALVTMGSDDTVLPILAPVAIMILVDAFSRKVDHLDFAGHEAETLFAERRGIANYRTAEQDSVGRDYGIAALVAGKRMAGMRWLARFLILIGRHRVPPFRLKD